MATEFKVPDLGENVDEGDIVSVMVKEGDEIQAEQSVMEIETGKAVVELPCPIAGRITKVHVQKGSKVKVGDPLLTVESADGKAAAGQQPKQEATSAPAKENGQQPQSEPQAKAESKPVAEPAAKKPAAAAEGKKKATAKPAPAPRASVATSSVEAAPSGKTPPAGPATRRLARELGVDLAAVDGSGPHGRITEDDVKAAVRENAAAPRSSVVSPAAAALPEGTDEKDSWGLVRVQKMPSIRKTIARNMVQSWTTIPHVTNFDDADITELERIRKGGLTDYVGTEIKLTMMAFVMKAVAQSLKLHPLLNCSIDMENEQIIYKHYVNIGVAVDTERGLVVPVVRDVDRMSIPAIAQALTNVAAMARNATFKLADIKGGTFTISNMGAVGGVGSTPIINPPEVAVLLTGRSRKLPVVVEGDKVEVRLMMPLSLSYDHRIVDGGTAARFLNEVINYLKVPGRLLLAP
jgi:pyruvate/2-oxoglutarate dehydrogenase complex dihydrolipoamide acyltransferase (E2) component